jgi:hypothetical protein
VKRATKRELIVVATMISRMGRNPCVFRSDGVFGMHKERRAPLEENSPRIIRPVWRVSTA